MRSYVRAIVAVALPLALATGAALAMPTSAAGVVSLVRHTGALTIDAGVPPIGGQNPKTHPYVRVARAPEGTDGGYVDVGNARTGNLPDRTRVLILPLDSGGSGSVFTTIVFAQRANGPPFYAGYLTSGGHLDTAVKAGRIVATYPDYGANEPNCCPSHYIRSTYVVALGALKVLGRTRITKAAL